MALPLRSFRKGSGKPLLILHGLFGSSDNWRTHVNAFSRRYAVHALDLRNHGRSPNDPWMSYADMVGDLLAYMRTHNIDRPHILGHSLGGKVAMQMALRNTTLVDKLIVVDIAPRSYPADHDDILKALRQLEIESADRREEVDQQLSSHIEDERLRAFLLKNLRRTDNGQFTWRIDLEVLNDSYDELIGWSGHALGVFKGPALFLYGSDSNYLAEDDFNLIPELFPNARFEELRGGHWLHVEQPEAFTAAVDEFLFEGT